MSSQSPQPAHSTQEPSSLPEDASLEEIPAFGWTSYAEKMNGRFAMIGIIALLLIEVLTHQDFLSWLNLR
jgi:Chlorophyll A-B binding protein